MSVNECLCRGEERLSWRYHHQTQLADLLNSPQNKATPRQFSRRSLLHTSYTKTVFVSVLHTDAADVYSNAEGFMLLSELKTNKEKKEKNRKEKILFLALSSSWNDYFALSTSHQFLLSSVDRDASLLPLSPNVLAKSFLDA